jgi:hypothetical protein
MFEKAGVPDNFLKNLEFKRELEALAGDLAMRHAWAASQFKSLAGAG